MNNRDVHIGNLFTSNPASFEAGFFVMCTCNGELNGAAFCATIKKICIIFTTISPVSYVYAFIIAVVLIPMGNYRKAARNGAGIKRNKRRIVVYGKRKEKNTGD